MKKMMFFKAVMAAFLSFAIFACKPVNPEGDGGNNPGENPGGNEPEVPVESERSIKLYNADAEVASLEFTADAATYTLTVKANFQWDLDKNSNTWPAWLVKLNESVTGVLNETTELYEGTVTLAVDMANIASYYENKTGNILFTDAEDLEYTFKFPVTHTFEKPLEPASIFSNELGTNILTVTPDGKFKGTELNELLFTMAPGEGDTDFRVFPMVQIQFEEELYGQIELTKELLNMYAPNYVPGKWVTMTNDPERGWVLTLESYPETYVQGQEKTTNKALIFVLPSSVYGTWAHSDPNNLMWMMNKSALVDDNGNPYESVQKYVITINVEHSAN